MMKKIKVVLIGAGGRGIGYTNFFKDHGDMYELVAAADPIAERREYIKETHGVSDENLFTDWKDLLAKGKIADCAFICTQDKMHFEPCMAAIEAGYEIFLEKPISPDPEEVSKIVEAAEKKGVSIVVCHVLRYSLTYMKLKEIIDSGLIGDIASIVHIEGVGNVHQSHSFVRGPWSNSVKSSPMILQKSCHDMDILFWLTGKKCKNIQSFGSLGYFTEKNRPEGAPDYCLDGCPHSEKCPYSIDKVYLNSDRWFRLKVCKKPGIPTKEDLIEALKRGPYGRCVFACDNDVVDRQCVNIEFEDGICASFTMTAFNKGGRNMRVMGTKGEIIANLSDDKISVYDFETGKTTDYNPTEGIPKDIADAHGGGDYGLMEQYYEYITGNYTKKSIGTIRESSESHFMCFAAEYSRTHGGVTVNMEEFKKNIKNY